MVIELHGFPGSGKTTALTMIAQRSLNGKSTLGLPAYDTVFTSFPCPRCYQLDFAKLGRSDFRNCLIIVDEISLFADNRDYKSFSQDLVYFFKLHRHMNISLVWCSQSATDADKKIRAVTERSYIVEPFTPWFTVLKPIEKRHTIVNGSPDEKFSLAPPAKWVFVYRPKWYKYFDSFECKPLPPVELEFWEFGSDSQFTKK